MTWSAGLSKVNLMDGLRPSRLYRLGAALPSRDSFPEGGRACGQQRAASLSSSWIRREERGTQEWLGLAGLGEKGCLEGREICVWRSAGIAPHPSHLNCCCF